MAPWFWLLLGLGLGLFAAWIAEWLRDRCQHEWDWHTYARISLYDGRDPKGIPDDYKTQVSATCKRCGQPRSKTYRGIVEPKAVA